MKKSEEFNSQIEEELKKSFIRIQPDENFIRSLGQKLIKNGSTRIENSKKYLYNLFLIILGLFSGLSIFWILRRIIHSKAENGNPKIPQT